MQNFIHLFIHRVPTCSYQHHLIVEHYVKIIDVAGMPPIDFRVFTRDSTIKCCWYLRHSDHRKALNSLIYADVPLRSYSLTPLGLPHSNFIKFFGVKNSVSPGYREWIDVQDGDQQNVVISMRVAYTCPLSVSITHYSFQYWIYRSLFTNLWWQRKAKYKQI